MGLSSVRFKPFFARNPVASRRPASQARGSNGFFFAAVTVSPERAHKNGPRAQGMLVIRFASTVAYAAANGRSSSAGEKFLKSGAEHAKIWCAHGRRGHGRPPFGGMLVILAVSSPLLSKRTIG
jgi:hypothetical protein